MAKSGLKFRMVADQAGGEMRAAAAHGSGGWVTSTHRDKKSMQKMDLPFYEQAGSDSSG